MKQIYLFLFGVTLTCSRPSLRWQSDRIVYFTQDVGRPDGYSYKYQTELGNYREERGILRTSTNGNKYIDIIGSYGYTGNDGKRLKVTYRSDDKGYRITNSKSHANHKYHFQSRFHNLDNKQNSVSLHKPRGRFSSQLPGKTKNVDSDDILFIWDNAFDNDTSTNEVTPEGSVSENSQETSEQPPSLSDAVPSNATNDTIQKVEEKVTGEELDGEDVGNRVGFPPGLIPSLLGGG